MKVAIIGAGLAGLSCAFQLEKYGIEPVIFERKNYIGDSRCGACLYLTQVSRIFTNPFTYLNKKYGLKLIPMSQLKEITINSANKKTIIKGNEGYILHRGPQNTSIENQIYNKIKTPILFNTHIYFDNIKNDFEHIVVATGNESIARELGVWEDTFNAYSRLAVIKGDFKKNSSEVWFNTEFSKSGFAYLIPESSKSANLGLIVNDISLREINYYWKEFLETVNIEYKITETKENIHSCGFVNLNKTKDNVYFAGNTGGFTDSFIGIGGINAIESGLLAGEAIAKKLDYNLLVQPIIKHNIKLHELRKLMNMLNNNDFDNIINFIKLPIAKRIFYRNPFFKASMLAPIASRMAKFTP